MVARTSQEVMTMEAPSQLRRHHSFGSLNGANNRIVQFKDPEPYKRAYARPRSMVVSRDQSKPTKSPPIIDVPRQLVGSPILNGYTYENKPAATSHVVSDAAALSPSTATLPTTVESQTTSKAKANAPAPAPAPPKSAIFTIELPKRRLPGSTRVIYYSLDISAEITKLWDSGLDKRFDKLLRDADVDALGSASVLPVLAGKSAKSLDPRVLILCANSRQRKSLTKELEKPQWTQLRADLKRWCLPELVLVDTELGPRGAPSLAADTTSSGWADDSGEGDGIATGVSNDHDLKIDTSSRDMILATKRLPIAIKVALPGSNFKKYAGLVKMHHDKPDSTMATSKDFTFPEINTTTSESSVAVIGGLIEVDGQIFGLSVGHPFTTTLKKHGDTVLPTEPLSEEEADSDDEDDRYWDSLPGEPSSGEEEFSPSEAPSRASSFVSNDTPLSDSEFCHDATIIAISMADSAYWTLPGCDPPGIDQRPGNSDWSLMSLPSECVKPNRFYLGGTLGSRDVTEVLHETELEAGEVTILSARTGFVKGRLGLTPVGLTMQGAMFQLLPLSLPKNIEIGNSGSWVVMKDKLCGILVAGSGLLRLGYMLPITRVFESIRIILDAQSVGLPTSHAIKLASRTESGKLEAGFTRPTLQPTLNSNEEHNSNALDPTTDYNREDFDVEKVNDEPTDGDGINIIEPATVMDEAQTETIKNEYIIDSKGVSAQKLEDAIRDVLGSGTSCSQEEMNGHKVYKIRTDQEIAPDTIDAIAHAATPLYISPFVESASDSSPEQIVSPSSQELVIKAEVTSVELEYEALGKHTRSRRFSGDSGYYSHRSSHSGLHSPTDSVMSRDSGYFSARSSSDRVSREDFAYSEHIRRSRYSSYEYPTRRPRYDVNFPGMDLDYVDRYVYPPRSTRSSLSERLGNIDERRPRSAVIDTNAPRRRERETYRIVRPGDDDYYYVSRTPNSISRRSRDLSPPSSRRSTNDLERSNMPPPPNRRERPRSAIIERQRPVSLYSPPVYQPGYQVAPAPMPYPPQLYAPPAGYYQHPAPAPSVIPVGPPSLLPSIRQRYESTGDEAESPPQLQMRIRDSDVTVGDAKQSKRPSNDPEKKTKKTKKGKISDLAAKLDEVTSSKDGKKITIQVGDTRFSLDGPGEIKITRDVDGNLIVKVETAENPKPELDTTDKPQQVEQTAATNQTALADQSQADDSSRPWELPQVPDGKRGTDQPAQTDQSHAADSKPPAKQTQLLDWKQDTKETQAPESSNTVESS